jgi:hypothetical protein
LNRLELDIQTILSRVVVHRVEEVITITRIVETRPYEPHTQTLALTSRRP